MWTIIPIWVCNSFYTKPQCVKAEHRAHLQWSHSGTHTSSGILGAYIQPYLQALECLNASAWDQSALTVVGRRLLLLLPASNTATIGGPVVVVLLLVFNENLPQQLLWRGERLSRLQLKPNKRHNGKLSHLWHFGEKTDWWVGRKSRVWTQLIWKEKHLVFHI